LSSKSLKELQALIKSHFKPTPKAIAERFKFTGRKQRQGESVTQFLAALRELAVNCKFTTDLSIRLRDQFIFGVSSERMQRALFAKDDNVKLEEVLQLCAAMETADLSTALIRQSSSPSSHQYSSWSQEEQQIHQFNSSTHQQQHQQSQHHHHRSPSQQQNGQSHEYQNFNHENSSSDQQYSRQSSPARQKSCPNCGSRSHTHRRDCPHKEVMCYNCGKQGHFARLCRSPSQQQPQDCPPTPICTSNNMLYTDPIITDIRALSTTLSSESVHFPEGNSSNSSPIQFPEPSSRVKQCKSVQSCIADKVNHARPLPYFSRSSPPDPPHERRLTKSQHHLRATAHANTGVSPAKPLQQRKLRTMDHHHPKKVKSVQAAPPPQQLMRKQRVKMRVLCPDDPPWIPPFSKEEDKWSRGSKSLGPVSYQVKIGDHHRHRHHLDHISPASQPPPSQEAPFSSPSSLVPATLSSPVPMSPSAKQSTSSSSPCS